MVKKDILHGIIEAVERGESLRDAMISFLNAGYAKPEIEEAARHYQMMRIGLQNQPSLEGKQTESKQEKSDTIQKKEPSKKIEENLQNIKPKEEAPKPTQKIEQKVVQKVSNYDSPEKKDSKVLLIVLIVFLFLLLVGLATAFVFKDQILNFFNSFLG